MQISFPWPMSNGEWLAWSGAVATILFGLFTMFMPRLALRLFRLQPMDERNEVLAMPRAVIGGFHIGFGLCALLLAQPFIYLALGAAWGVAAFGAIVSLMSDGVRALYSWIFLVLALLLAASSLAFVFGFVS